MEFYVYVWRDSAGVPFYVGKGKDRRSGKISTRSRDFKDIHAKGGCSVEIIDWFIHESQAHAYEVELIERYGRLNDCTGTLVNKTDGGEGTSGVIKTVSDEARAKISKALTGKTPSAETRAKMSIAGKGRPKSDDHRAKIGIGNSNPSAETRERQSVAQRATWSDRDIRARHSVLLLSPAIAAARSKRLRLAGPTSSNKSGFKGVSFNAEKGKWCAFITAGNQRFLGWFHDPKDAALAYDTAAHTAWGVDCYLNFPDIIGDAIAA